MNPKTCFFFTQQNMNKAADKYFCVCWISLIIEMIMVKCKSIKALRSARRTVIQSHRFMLCGFSLITFNFIFVASLNNEPGAWTNNSVMQKPHLTRPGSDGGILLLMALEGGEGRIGQERRIEREEAETVIELEWNWFVVLKMQNCSQYKSMEPETLVMLMWWQVAAEFCDSHWCVCELDFE